MFGVSPAFILSKHGQSFTVDQFTDSLDHIKNLGFSGFQPEIFHLKELDKWYNGGASKVSNKAKEIELKPTQFVAHFLLESFSTEKDLFSDFGILELEKVITITEVFDKCNTIVIPVGQFISDNISISYEGLKERLIEKTGTFLEIISAADKKLALEIMPYSVVEGIGGFMELSQKLNSDYFGISLDTGHAWACREMVEQLPLKLKGKVFGLHLCDNDSNINNSLSPGKGTIKWENLIYNLINSGYEGSYDIEIICSPQQVDEEFESGLRFIENLIKKYS